MEIVRKHCVLCFKSLFIDCFDIVNTINVVDDLSIPFDESELKILNFVGCTNCGCVQLHNLSDPEQIYAHASTYTESDIWKRHDDLFSKFIMKYATNKTNICEIGGGTCKLANIIINNTEYLDNKYTILDMLTNHVEINKNIIYIIGNCEVFDFNTLVVDTIILSHVFEHLYEPRKFIQNICNTQIKEIFISIPDMEKLTKNNDYNNLHIQHTYYIDTNFITGLFKKYNYKLHNIYNFENDSIFYYFVKDVSFSDIITLHDFKNVALIQTLKNFYLELVNKIQAIVIDKPFYICPSGFYGKIVYHYLKQEIKNNVIGFLDSDKYKINKRLTGTKCTIFDKNYIKNMDNVTILVIAEKYKKEIVDELLSYNTNIEFICM